MARTGKVRSKGGYDSISLVTTGNDYSPSCTPHSAAAVTRAAPPLRGPSDVERTFPLKDVTGFIARANYDASCSNDECQRWIIGRHLADVIPPLTRLRLTKNGWRVLMRIGPDNYRSVMHLSIERSTARSNDEDVIECLTGDYRFLQLRHSFSRRRVQSSTCRI